MLHKNNNLATSKDDLIVELMSLNMRSEKQQQLFKSDNKDTILIDNFHRVNNNNDSSQTNFLTNSNVKAKTERA